MPQTDAQKIFRLIRQSPAVFVISTSFRPGRKPAQAGKTHKKYARDVRLRLSVTPTCLAPKCNITSACPTKLVAPVAFLFHDGLFHYLICSASELLLINLLPLLLPRLPQTPQRSLSSFLLGAFSAKLSPTTASRSSLAHSSFQLPRAHAILLRIASQLRRRTRATRWTTHNVLRRRFRGLWLQ